jgi:hypothetical protein
MIDSGVTVKVKHAEVGRVFLHPVLTEMGRPAFRILGGENLDFTSQGFDSRTAIES